MEARAAIVRRKLGSAMLVRVAFAVIFLLLLLPAQACRNELQAPTTAIAKGLGSAVEQGTLTSRANAPGGVVFDRGEIGRPDAIAVATELGNSGLDHLILVHNHKVAIRSPAAGAPQLWETRFVRRGYRSSPTATGGHPKASEPRNHLSKVADLSAASIDQLKVETYDLAVLARGAAELSSPVIPPRPLRRPFRQNLELNRSAS
jgi:hypothetical protein